MCVCIWNYECEYFSWNPRCKHYCIYICTYVCMYVRLDDCQFKHADRQTERYMNLPDVSAAYFALVVVFYLFAIFCCFNKALCWSVSYCHLYVCIFSIYFYFSHNFSVFIFLNCRQKLFETWFIRSHNLYVPFTFE